MRTFTLREANRLLPKINSGLAAAKQTLDELRNVRDQLADLRIIWGDRVESTDCPDHKEYLGYHEKFVVLEAEMSRRLRGITDLGCEIKDPDRGLVDFYAKRGSDLVYLCWQRGEPEIQFWHSLNAGFAGRQPMRSF